MNQIVGIVLDHIEETFTEYASMSKSQVQSSITLRD